MPSSFEFLLPKCSILLFIILLVIEPTHVESSTRVELSTDYYYYSCPEALQIVEDGVLLAIKSDARMGASLLRLHFHDCFVNGCDGSVLLDDNASFTGEKSAFPNAGSLRGFEVVDQIKAKLEEACPRVVSCADILAMAARHAVYHLGGPSWEVKMGRRDSLTANVTAANVFLPSPSSDIATLTAVFSGNGLSFKDMVALSGAHTIGFARCKSFRSRIYNDHDISPSFAQYLQTNCPKNGNDTVLQALDLKTPSHFDNLYYKNLLVKKGLLHSDQEIYNSNKADPIVRKFSRSITKFYKSFAKAMIKMGNLSPLMGTQGQIRVQCRKPN